MQVNFTDNENRSDRYGRYAYMDFGLSDIDKETLSTAKLWIYVDPNSDTRYSTRTIGIFAPSTTWSANMTWSSGRVATSGDAIGAYTVTGNGFDIIDYGWKCIDVTDYVKNLSSDNASFMMKTTEGNAHPVLLRSNEHSDEATRPKLVLYNITDNDIYSSNSAGLVWNSWDEIQANTSEIEDNIFLQETLPSAFDITENCPAPHNIGQNGSGPSCTSWAVAYALKSHQEHTIRDDWELNTDEHLFSPNYIHNQKYNKEVNGVSIIDAMNVIVEQGVCTIKSFPPTTDLSKSITPEMRDEAAQYKSAGIARISGIENMKRYLAEGKAVVIGIEVFEQFEEYNIKPIQYVSIANSKWTTVLDPKSNTNIYVYNSILNKDGTTPEEETDGHSICLVGYDDNIQAFKFINSWGLWLKQNRGYDGYGWISYDMVKDERVNRHRDGNTNEPLGFTLLPHKIIATATDGGEIIGIKDTGAYGHLEIVELEAKPKESFVFEGWYENGKKIQDAEQIYSFTADGNRTIEARFRANGASVPYFIMATAGENGIVTGGGIYYGCDGSCEVSCAETVTLVATPDEGYIFEGWYEDGVKINCADATYSFIAENDRLLEARFIPEE